MNIIKGIAWMNNTPPNTVYSEEALEQIAQQIIGKPVIVDDKAVGKILESWVENKKVYYHADMEPVYHSLHRKEIKK